MDHVCHDFHWDSDYVLPIVRQLCQSGDVLGDVHESSGSTTGAMYVPTVYLTLQRKSVDEFFAANGFMALQDCRAMGVLESKLGEFLQETNVSVYRVH